MPLRNVTYRSKKLPDGSIERFAIRHGKVVEVIIIKNGKRKKVFP